MPDLKRGNLQPKIDENFYVEDVDSHELLKQVLQELQLLNAYHAVLLGEDLRGNEENVYRG